MPYLVANLFHQKLKQLSSQQLFEIKQKFLMDIPHPKLILKHLESLIDQPIQELLSADQGPDKSLSLLDFLQLYMDQLMTLKLSISNSTSQQDLSVHLHSLFIMQSDLIQKLASYYPDEINIDKSLVKQSDPFNVFEYIKELETRQVEENQIKSYLCVQFEANDLDRLSTFGRAIIRARKIEEHDG